MHHSRPALAWPPIGEPSSGRKHGIAEDRSGRDPGAGHQRGDARNAAHGLTDIDDLFELIVGIAILIYEIAPDFA